jgi:hypothetical protein
LAIQKEKGERMSRNWKIECKKCGRKTEQSVGKFRKIIQMDFEFLLKPAFVCANCKEDCEVTLTGER